MFRALFLAVVAAGWLGACASPNSPLVFSADRGSVQQVRVDEPGYVVVRYDVDERGRVLNPTVMESVPDGRYDAAALAVVRDWSFVAARRDGERVATQGVTSRIDFKASADD